MNKLTICAYAASKPTPTLMTSALVAHGTHVGDSHQNRTVWFGLQLIAPEEFRRRKFLRSPRLIFDDAYLLGADLLVAPIFSESCEPVARRLYLPAGEWVDFWTDERISGGRYITRTSALDTIPVYVCTGTILPSAPERPFIGDEVPDELTVNVYTGAEGMARVVWDASGNASRLHLQRSRGGWQLDIEVDRIVTWSVSWHTGTGIVEAGSSRVASTSFMYP